MTVDIGFFGAWLGGVLSLLSPCSVMLLPAFFAYAFGSRAALLGRTGVFFLGLVTTLVPLGVLAGSAGAWLSGHRTALLIAAAVVVMALGVVQIAGLSLPGLSRRGQTDVTTGPAVYALGAAYGLAGACTGPLLGSVLTLAAAGGSPVYGATLLAVYAAGMTVSLLVLALVWKRLGARGRAWIRPRGISIGRWRTSLHALVSGAFSVALGVALLVFAADSEALGSVLDVRTQFALEVHIAELGRAVPDVAVLAAAVTVLLVVFAADTLRRRRGTDARRVLTRLWPWVATAARVLLGGVFVVAGALKMPDPAAAERAVRAYQLLPEALVAPVAFGLPVLEIAVGLALLAGVFVRTAALSTAVLLAVFIAGIASAWARGLRIDCGCFGDGGQVAADQTAYGTELARDIALLLPALALARWPRSRLALGRAAGQPEHAPDPPHHDDHDDHDHAVPVDPDDRDHDDLVHATDSTRTEPTRAH